MWKYGSLLAVLISPPERVHEQRRRAVGGRGGDDCVEARRMSRNARPSRTAGVAEDVVVIVFPFVPERRRWSGRRP